eukprot:6175131-Pleurochrysis_carterae.AAC.2
MGHTDLGSTAGRCAPLKCASNGVPVSSLMKWLSGTGEKCFGVIVLPTKMNSAGNALPEALLPPTPVPDWPTLCATASR